MVETMTPEIIIELWPMVVFYFVFSGIAVILGLLGSRILGISKHYQGFLLTAMIFSNTNSLPISLLKGIMQSSGASVLFQGPDDTPFKATSRAITYAVIFVMFNNIFRWTVGVRLMGPHAEAQQTLKAKISDYRPHHHLVQCPSNVSIAIHDESSFSSPSSLYGSTDNLNFGSSSLSATQEGRNGHDDLRLLGNDLNALQSGSGHSTGRTTPACTCPSSPESEPLLSRTTTAHGDEDDFDLDSNDTRSSPDGSTSAVYKIGRKIKKMLHSVKNALNPPMYAIIAAAIVQFVPYVNDIVMDPESIFMPVVKAVDVSGEACIPAMLLTLGAQMAFVNFRPSGTASTTHSSSSKPNTTNTLSSPPPVVTLEDADARSHYHTPSHGASTTLVMYNQEEEEEEGHNSTGISGSAAVIGSSTSDSCKITLLVMISRFVLIPAIVVPLLLFLRPFISIASKDPVFLITLFVLCSMPPAVNLITVAQAMGVFEEESAKLLFWIYFLAIPILMVLIAIYLVVLAAF
ncbi:hypothetical protein IWQ61_001654 [Dispira simplex]|nr:hypothetical protein IWQ61_001654 [Dispira simplex]